MKFAAGLVVLLSACPRTDLPDTPPKTIEKISEDTASVERCAEASPLEERVTLVGTAIEREKGVTIHFRLTNVSSLPLRLNPFDLPWGNLNAVAFAAVTSNRHTLGTAWPIDDPGVQEPIILAPGHELEGEVLLAYRIPGVDEAHAHEDINVSWCYRFVPIGETGGRLTGLLKIPKRAV